MVLPKTGLKQKFEKSIDSGSQVIQPVEAPLSFCKRYKIHRDPVCLRSPVIPGLGMRHLRMGVWS